MANSVERIILPDDAWADVRNPKKVPERLRRPVREAAINLQLSLPPEQRAKAKVAVGKEPDEVATEDTQQAFGAPPIDELVEEAKKEDEIPFLPNTEQQGFVDAYNESLLLSVVTAWSYGDVNVEVLRDLPGDAFDVLMDTVRNLGDEGEENSLDSDPSSP